jgi:hypothetical protein
MLREEQLHVVAGTAWSSELQQQALAMVGSGHLPTFRLIQVGLLAAVIPQNNV